MPNTLDQQGMDLLFRKARTHNAWLDRPVSEETLRRVYELMKWGPTSANSCPARILFLRTPQAKARLLPALSPGNVEKTRAAPRGPTGNHGKDPQRDAIRGLDVLN